MSEFVVVLNGPSTEVDYRIEAALDLQDRLGVDLVASGGFTEDRVELMRSETGDHFYREAISRDTLSNALYTQTDILAVQPSIPEALHVVTSDYHVNRAGWLFGEVTGLGVVQRPVETNASSSRSTRTERGLVVASAALLYGLDLKSEPGLSRAKRRARTLFFKRY